MILEGNKRGGAMQMAKHLMNADQNEHVNVHEVRGFISSSVTGALQEAYGISKATQCRQFMFSLSLNPPPDKKVPISVFEQTLEQAEKQLKLSNQPRVVVFHEKEGRRHAHVIWSRIDADKMIAIDQPFYKNRLQEVSRSIFLKRDWKMPEGFRDKSRKNPLNFSRAEWQQALRVERHAQDIKREIQEAWAVSDSRKGFENALQDAGYYLARGDRRPVHLAVDIYGEAYPLHTYIGKTRQAIKDKLGDPKALSTVQQTQQTISRTLKPTFDRYIKELKTQQRETFAPLTQQKIALTKQHQEQRSQLDEQHEKRWQIEENLRASRMRHGFKGLWDKLTGKYWKVRQVNERQTYQAYQRDRAEREQLIAQQLTDRQQLQTQIKQLQEQHAQEKQELLHDLVELSEHSQAFEQEWVNQLDHHSRFDHELDHESFNTLGDDNDIDNDL